MRNHDARVILAACLLSGAAAAQAPAIESYRIRDWDPSTRTSTYDGSGSANESLRSDYFDGRRAPEPQDDNPYTLRTMFLDAHRDFMDRRERYDPLVEFGGRWFPNQRINHEPGSFDWIGYEFDAEAPILVAPDGYLMIGAYYTGRSYKFSNAMGSAGNPGGGLNDEVLTGTGVTLGFGMFLDPNLFFEVETNPGIWSDLDGGLHSEDYDFPSFALFTYRAADNLFFKFGARYNQIFEDAPWLPYLGVSWEIVEGFRFDLLAPETVEFSFWPSASTGFLFGAEVDGAEYHVRASLASREANPPGTADVHVQEVLAYVGMQHRFTDNVSFLVRGGLVVAGDYDLSSGATGFNPADGALDQGAFVDFTFGIHF
jgi:hypothetical protein